MQQNAPYRVHRIKVCHVMFELSGVLKHLHSIAGLGRERYRDSGHVEVALHIIVGRNMHIHTLGGD